MIANQGVAALGGSWPPLPPQDPLVRVRVGAGTGGFRDDCPEEVRANILSPGRLMQGAAWLNET
ncbi:MAG TPA: hypothetical protein VNW92_20375 [Polyangiaceae bacterium]|nr:hypothetical protein [Polyangiaceae bacterium]